MEGVSIIVCCYNSARHIEKCLGYLKLQKGIDNNQLEIILVDNNSNDNTSSVAQNYWSTVGAPFPLKIKYERRQGLNFARQNGVANAIFPYLVFCDDDNLLDPFYAANVLSIFTNYSHYGIIGANVQLDASKKYPDWFVHESGMYAINSHNSSSELNDAGVIVGAGMALRKRLADDIFSDKFPMLCIGPSGETERRADDVEICLRCEIIGYAKTQAKCLVLIHSIEESRISKQYLNRLKTEGAIDWHYITNYLLAIKCAKKRYWGKLVFSMKHYMKWIVGYIMSNKKMVSHAKTTLFFCTGWHLNKNENAYSNEIIYQFIRMNNNLLYV